MSPRAACRLETLGFEHVYDYLPGKVDWLARNLPTHGENADRPTAIEAAMEPGPSTVRPHLGADELLERLRSRNLTTAIVTTPEGRLVGVVHRHDLEQAHTTGGPGA